MNTAFRKMMDNAFAPAIALRVIFRAYPDAQAWILRDGGSPEATIVRDNPAEIATGIEVATLRGRPSLLPFVDLPFRYRSAKRFARVYVMHPAAEHGGPLPLDRALALSGSEFLRSAFAGMKRASG